MLVLVREKSVKTKNVINIVDYHRMVHIVGHAVRG